MAGVMAALTLISIDRSRLISPEFLKSYWIYDGGGTGARTLLGAIASSTIGVAGTVFSITIAALSLAAGQMGPRLLRNFVKDRGNQFSLGAFLATFSYALMVLRSVRTQSEGPFVPHLALSVAILLALVCVATLVYFVGHMAGRINVDVVINLVAQDVRASMDRLTQASAPAPAGPLPFSCGGQIVVDGRNGYLQEIDRHKLVRWALKHDAVITLMAKPGSYIFPGAPIALVTYRGERAPPPLSDSLSIGQQRVDSADLEFAVRHLVEVAVRALSPGINDPHTAISVLDHLGVALCHLAPLSLPSGVISQEGRIALVIPAVNYDGLTDTMFHLIRQNAQNSTAVLIRIIEILTVVASCDRNVERLAVLRRHADLVLDDAGRSIANPKDLMDVRRRHMRFVHMSERGTNEYWAPSGANAAICSG